MMDHQPQSREGDQEINSMVEELNLMVGEDNKPPDNRTPKQRKDTRK